MSRFLNSKYLDLDEYVPGEQPKDMVYTKLNTNESPYPPGPRTIMAVTDGQRAARLRLYSDPDSQSLCRALAERYKVRPDNVFVSNGSDDILNFAFMAFCQDGVLFPEISYGFYEVFARLHKADFVKVPLRQDFTIDPQDYMDKGKAVVIANPNAPTGLALSREQIEKIAESEADNVVLIDEAYVDFGGDSVVDLTSRYDNLLVVRTFSKSRSLAGARLGFAIGNEKLIADLIKLKYSTNPYNVNAITAAAGEAAIEEDDYYRSNCRRIVDTRENTVKSLINRGFNVIPSKANFIFVNHDSIDGASLYMELKKRKILIRHFDNPLISQYNRITIGTPLDMEIMLDAIDEILDGRKEQ